VHVREVVIGRERRRERRPAVYRTSAPFSGQRASRCP
jgi:hypothetical protein